MVSVWMREKLPRGAKAKLMSSKLFPDKRVLLMPLETGWTPPSSLAQFCCPAMEDALDFSCAQHADPFECPDSLVTYNEVFDEFGLIVHDGGPSYVLIGFCPWCGTKLPESQRDRWFDETEAKGFTDETLPPEYRTGAWRRVK
jgi:hypothetical protein